MLLMHGAFSLNANYSMLMCPSSEVLLIGEAGIKDPETGHFKGF